MSKGMFRLGAQAGTGVNTGVRQLCCQGCGATLPVAEGIRFISCNYCNARLEVIQSESTTHTKLLEEIGHRTERIERKLDFIELRQQLSHLDDCWNRFRDSVSTRDRSGNLHPPSMDMAMGGVVIGGMLSLVIGGTLFAQYPFAALPLIAGAVWLAMRFWSAETIKVSAFQASRAKYEIRRRQLLRLIEEGSSSRRAG